MRRYAPHATTAELEEAQEALLTTDQPVEEVNLAAKVASAAAALACVSLACWSVYDVLDSRSQEKVREWFLLCSIPVIACLFTWFHIWLALQMMFLPIEFLGIWQYQDTGQGIGWQGVVPRKAMKMATIAFGKGRMHFMGPREMFGRVDARVMTQETMPKLKELVDRTLGNFGEKKFPGAFKRLPAVVRDELTQASLERMEEIAHPLWAELSGVLAEEKRGLDNDRMFVKAFTENKELLNDFFTKMGAKEIKFIEHCGAVMGFVCGLMQLIAFNNLSHYGRAIFLPVSGFFLGIVTNWLAIQMCFRPCNPIPINCGCFRFQIQGLFIARQAEVCEVYSKMLVDHFFNFDHMIEYLGTLSPTWEVLKEIFLRHNRQALDDTMGMLLRQVAPVVFGKQEFKEICEDFTKSLVVSIAQDRRLQKACERYMMKVMDINETNKVRLKAMPPEDFEQLLHPIFQEDEWILILLGGVLGAAIGAAQVYFLTS